MGAERVLLSMLVAVFLMAGLNHLLIWARNIVAREHLWFALSSLSMCAAVALHYLLLGEPNQVLAVHVLPLICTLAWLVATTWFAVEYAACDHRRRRAALVATVLLAIAGLGEVAGRALAGTPALSGFLLTVRIPAVAAIGILMLLLIDGASRLWTSGQRMGATVLLATVVPAGIVALLVIPGRAWPELPSAAIYAFVVVVLLVSYELARAIADGELISQRQRHELAHASRLSIVGELTASIAHEINQPLGAILNNADAGEILMEGPDPPLDELRRILADIRRDGLRASEVIRHVRRMVRKRELELERLDANVLVTDVITLLEAEARRRRMAISSGLAPNAAFLRGDRALLEQVLINLILNAMDAIESMPAGDPARPVRNTIHVAVAATSHGEVELRVTDAGPGIPATRLTHLFDSFHTSKPHGMGLGLSIARSIAEAHGGRIRAENNAEAGATFRIILPPFDEAQG